MIKVFRDISKIHGKELDFPPNNVPDSQRPLQDRKEFRSVVTIGNFDGFHLGHRALLKTLRMRSQCYGAPSVVVTFSPHPTQVLFPGKSSQRMFDLVDQYEVLEELGIDILIEENFTKEYAELSPEDFFLNKIYQNLKPHALVVGYDFCFGKNRAGNLEKLGQLCQQAGVEFVVEPAAQWRDLPISSTRIREALRLGDPRSAGAMLGRPYYFSGIVKSGAQRGRHLGIPTANIYPELDFVPQTGVYVSRTTWQGRVLDSITNFGVNPTFALSKESSLSQNSNKAVTKVETHILDFSEDLYGQKIKVELLEFLRPEKKFSGAESLLHQIREDILKAKLILAGMK